MGSQVPKEEGDKKLKAVKDKVKAAKKVAAPKKNPRVDNDPAIQGDNDRRHGTWGTSRDTGPYDGRHRS